MKLILEIKDSKADFMMELLKSLPFVKTKPLPDSKEQILADLKESVKQVNLSKQGKIKLKSAKELLDELE